MKCTYLFTKIPTFLELHHYLYISMLLEAQQQSKVSGTRYKFSPKRTQSLVGFHSFMS